MRNRGFAQTLVTQRKAQENLGFFGAASKFEVICQYFENLARPERFAKILHPNAKDLRAIERGKVADSE